MQFQNAPGEEPSSLPSMIESDFSETDAAEDYVPAHVAARLTGVSVQRIRAWVRAGMVATKPGIYGHFVCLADVHAGVALAQPSAGPG